MVRGGKQCMSDPCRMGTTFTVLLAGLLEMYDALVGELPIQRTWLATSKHSRSRLELSNMSYVQSRAFVSFR